MTQSSPRSSLEIIAPTVEQTLSLGRRIGRLAPTGLCIALEGMLGTGKTQLVRGIALGAEVADIGLVNSPSYVLLNVYQAAADNPESKTVYHLDAYRVQDSSAFAAVGLPELLEMEGIVAIEWASRVADLLPDDYLLVRGESIDDSTRRWHLTAHGPQSTEMLTALAAMADC
jgi:tRNA threonylcarbamoyladenosine biosynthesis protein TsaE